jgi:hypothetical protein
LAMMILNFEKFLVSPSRAGRKNTLG